jgi:hypothetical protein
MTDTAGLVTLAVPCRADEPALGRALTLAWQSWRRMAGASGRTLEVVVCLNGDRPRQPLADVREFAAALDAPLVEDGGRAATSPAPITVVVLASRRAGKPIAWNLLRRAARGPLALFMDADVAFEADAFGLLLGALAEHPAAALASGRTTCASRPGLFERIMAAPYGVDFPNLSPQLYAARVAALPLAMPEDLLEPERWLELIVGCERVVRVPGAEVQVRLPHTIPDFYRQRIRIEMGKVQLARDYPGLAARGAPQPRGAAALTHLGATQLGCLAAYLALRTSAHAIARWRYRRGRTDGIWRQAVSTKRWDPE